MVVRHRRNLGRIQGLSKGLSRKVEGSQNWWKKLAQAVSDASFFEVKRQLLYKAEQYGSYVQLIDRWFPSSKTCHVCGWVKQELTLADRVWVCEQCGTVHDRDLNAAIMVETEALRKVPDVPVVASSERKIACGAERSGSLCAESETVCGEAGTKVL